MTAPTVNPFAGEWDAIGLAKTGISHRATTSSRHPGRVFEGSVHYEVRGIAPCPDCGFMRRDVGGPHAPRLNAEHHLVDCAGRPVAAEFRTGPGDAAAGSRPSSPRRRPPQEPATVPETPPPAPAPEPVPVLVFPKKPKAADPELGRVSERIGAAIVEFARAHLGQQFHADELRAFVRERVGEVAPDSASRILRDLRQQQVIGYELVSRPKSLYRITAVAGSP